MEQVDDRHARGLLGKRRVQLAHIRTRQAEIGKQDDHERIVAKGVNRAQKQQGRE
jgi:hypothetical protein